MDHFPPPPSSSPTRRTNHLFLLLLLSPSSSPHMKTSTLISSQGRRRFVSRQHAALTSSFRTLILQPSLEQRQRHTHKPPTSITPRWYHSSITTASDNFLGYSPMAQPLPRSTNSGKAATDTSSKTPTAIWGVDSNTAGGGVWAQTSAKKDKLNELLTDLNGEGIDTGKLGVLMSCVSYEHLNCRLLISTSSTIYLIQGWNRWIWRLIPNKSWI
jgi:hypothetical protein